MSKPSSSEERGRRDREAEIVGFLEAEAALYRQKAKYGRTIRHNERAQALEEAAREIRDDAHHEGES